MAEAPIEIMSPISGYVVAPDRSVKGRAAAFWRAHRWTVLRRLVVARHAARRMGAVGEAALSQVRALPWQRVWGGLRDFGLGILGLFLLLRHVMRPRAVLLPPKRRRSGGLVLVAVLLAVLAAMILPDREQAMPSAEAHVAAIAPEEPVAPALLADPILPSVQLVALPAVWTPVRRPIPMFHLEAPDLAGLELHYQVATRGPSRQDTLTFLPRAQPASEPRRSHVHLVIERHDGLTSTERPLFADLAARSAELHFSIERMSRPQPLQTKFGTMEAAEAQIRRDGQDLPCIGFRRIDMTGITLAGWVCGLPNKAVDRVSLACLIDRIDLLGAGRDAVLRRAFAEAERSRLACSSSRQSGRRLTWLDHEAPLPQLKLSARGR